MRDDFSAKVKRTLAARTGYLCSNPDCRHPTSGPGQNPDEICNVGVAAHITAASPGSKENPAPRYDATLSAEQRRDIANGIWLCANCGKLIDDDVDRFPLQKLREWKKKAEDDAFIEIASSSTPIARLVKRFAELDEADLSFIQSLQLKTTESIDNVTDKAKAAAENDIQAFRSTSRWPTRPVEIRLAMDTNGRRRSITLDGAAKALGVSGDLSFVSGPGQGKSTTMVQLAQKIFESGLGIAILVPIGEWASSREHIFSFLCHRNAFRGFREQHFRMLAFYGRLVLLIDGWNEIDSQSRVDARRHLNALRRDYPLMGIVFGTRRQATPVPGPVLELEPLTEEQQLDIARRSAGGNGEEILDRAWRTPGLRELITIPLYLDTLLAVASSGVFPKNKEQILAAFVDKHERESENAERLRQVLHGSHREILVALAVEAQKAATVCFSEADARKAIADAEKLLAAAGQLTSLPQPAAVLDVLVAAHLLVRTDASAASISFQHQQFQEWFASLYVERLMHEAVGGQPDSLKTLKSEILNWTVWEEAVLFASERLARQGASGAKIAAKAIVTALSVHPMLAAEMVFRCGDTAWKFIGKEVIVFAEKWHRPGSLDRAMRFMVTTGRQEFSSHVWPLISNPDPQIHLQALRIADRFRPSVLGPNPVKMLSAMEAKNRASTIPAIAHQGSPDALELTAEIAKAETDSHVVVEIIEALLFRGSDRLIRQIMASASAEVWKALANYHYEITLSDPAQRAKLAELRRSGPLTSTDYLQEINKLTEIKPPAVEIGEEIKRRIEAPALPLKNVHAHLVIERASNVYPEQVGAAIINRLIKGLELPPNLMDLVKTLDAKDSGPLAESVLDPNNSEKSVRYAIALAGPITVGKLIEQILPLHERIIENAKQLTQTEREKYTELHQLITSARWISRVHAVIPRSVTQNPNHIGLYASFLARINSTDAITELKDDPKTREALVKILADWSETLLKASEIVRGPMAEVAQAMAATPHPSFLQKLKLMLRRDGDDWRRAREEMNKSARRHGVPINVSMNYKLQYAGAFAAIGNDEALNLMTKFLPDLEFGQEAARALWLMWIKAHPPSGERTFGGWTDFSAVNALREAKRSGALPPTSEIAEKIFFVATQMGKPQNDVAQQTHAVALTTIALELPHGDKEGEINSLLALPVAWPAKRKLLTQAARTGETISTKDLMAGLDELFEGAKAKRWRLDESNGEFMSWIELFPFSDEPMAVFAALDRLPGASVPWKLERLLIALGDGPNDNALAILRALVERDERFLNSDRWMFTVLKQGTEESANLLLELILNNKLNERAQLPIRRFAALVMLFPAVRKKVLSAYFQSRPGKSQTILEMTLAEIADPEIVLTFVRRFAADRRPYNGWLDHAVREIAVGKRPIDNNSNHYEAYSRSLTEFRKELYRMVLGGGDEAGIARICLETVDGLRDEYGRIPDEPVHPDISRDRPWPIVPTS